MQKTYIAPCKDCEKRQEHCHSQCKIYADWKAEQEKLKKWKAEHRNIMRDKARRELSAGYKAGRFRK